MTYATLTVAASLFETTLGVLVGAGGAYALFRATMTPYWKY